MAGRFAIASPERERTRMAGVVVRTCDNCDARVRKPGRELVEGGVWCQTCTMSWDAIPRIQHELGIIARDLDARKQVNYALPASVQVEVQGDAVVVHCAEGASLPVQVLKQVYVTAMDVEGAVKRQHRLMQELREHSLVVGSRS